MEPQRSRSDPLLHELFEPDKGAPADEQYVRRVDLDVLLVGVLSAALRRDIADRAFKDLEQRLLHPLTRHIAGDRDVFRGAADLVDLVDVDDSALGLLDVIARGLQ